VAAVSWQKFRLDNFHLGMLRITTFAFASFNETTLDLVEKLLLNELADTDGLLLDMRDNTGGSVSSSASLVQFFKENPVSMNGHFKITKETRSLYENSALGQSSDK
jgi:C-terminal processing protease CtpA/Prc